MKKVVVYVIMIVLAFTIIFSCQKELNPDPTPVSTGSILKDSNNNCLPVVVSGRYNKNQSLNDSNYLQVNINVTSPGIYTINTDTINDYSFFASGIFASNGIQIIKLRGAGNPVIADTDHFTIKYNRSFCEATIVVTDTSLKPAVYKVSSNSGNCMDNTIYGSYIKSVALDSTAQVKILVDVSSTGTYSINTNAINGYSFSASGIFTTTGSQVVTLKGLGTPINAETDIFDVSTSTSSCSFSINVLTPLNIIGNDYYPLTKNSYWIYDDLVNIGDTIKETIIDSTNINNNFYKVMQQDVHFGGPYQYYYRKTGTDYFEYAAPNKYTTFFQYKKPVYADIPFLKEKLTTNSFWQSQEYIDTTTTGDVISLKYNFTCLNANASVTVNGKAFANVYEIKMQPLIKQTGGYDYTGEVYNFYYAKGVGLIYMKKILASFIQQEIAIRNWQVY